MNRFENRVAIVTGGGSGVGRATALRLAAEGAAVSVVDINGDAAEAVAEEARAAGAEAIAFIADVSSETEIANLVAETIRRFGGIDVLHNNAALLSSDIVGRDRDIATFDRGVFDHVIAVNLIGPILGCKHCIRPMVARGGGAIVNTTSIAAHRGGSHMPIYAMTKAGIEALTRYVATLYGKENIRCNSVAPGTILTPANILQESEEQDRLRSVLTTRLGQPDDIAAAVAFLASNDAEYITGQTIIADGGRTAYV